MGDIGAVHSTVHRVRYKEDDSCLMQNADSDERGRTIASLLVRLISSQTQENA